MTRVLATHTRIVSKPTRTPVVIMAHEVKCVCGCLWLATEKLVADPGNRCPDCERPPIVGRVGSLEPHSVTIPIHFSGGMKSVVPL